MIGQACPMQVALNNEGQRILPGEKRGLRTVWFRSSWIRCLLSSRHRRGRNLCVERESMEAPVQISSESDRVYHVSFMLPFPLQRKLDPDGCTEVEMIAPAVLLQSADSKNDIST